MFGLLTQNHPNKGDASKTALQARHVKVQALVSFMQFLELCILTLWLYMPGFLANTFAMLWGKWLPKTGYGPWPIDGGRTLSDGNRILGDGKTWNGLIGGSLTSGLLSVLIVSLMGDIPAAGAAIGGKRHFHSPIARC
jgi:dolichol kinase